MKDGLEAQVAHRIRELRVSRGMTLDDFEKFTGGSIKAVVIGSYERGSRSVSLSKLVQLAEIFEVDIQYFLSQKNETSPHTSWRFDLRKLRSKEEGSLELEIVKDFLQTIAYQRGDWRGEILTLRESDSRALAIAVDRNGFLTKLRDAKILIN
jgi:transcriptional regulator with XRE-family HTH domain